MSNTQIAIEAVRRLEVLEKENAELRDALRDMLAGWRYIRSTHGDLYGVGWDRAEQKAEAAMHRRGNDLPIMR